MTQNEIDHILQHISEGNKLLAVKELMDKAQISLKDSAEIINLIAEGKESDLNICLQRIKGGGFSEQPSSHTTVGSYISKNKIEEIQEFVHQGYKLAAVKALKDASGVDLKQAKDIIDDLFLDNTIDLNARIASAKSHYSENYERISATSDANGSNVHFYYQRGNVKEEVTPGHPMWERVKAQYSHEWEGVPEDIVKAREPFRKAVLEMEAQAGVSGGKREDTLFIKKKSFNIFEGIKWYFILALAACIIYMIWSIWSIFNKA